MNMVTAVVMFMFVESVILVFYYIPFGFYDLYCIELMKK